MVNYNRFYIDDNNAACYMLNGAWHRLDGPCYVSEDGAGWAWMIYGRHHREDGPAAYFDNKYYWYINGLRYANVKNFLKDANLSDEESAILILKYE